MNNEETLRLIEELRASGRLFLPSLGAAYFVVQTPLLILTMLLPDIGETFSHPAVGVTGQLETSASIVGMVSAVLCAVWSERYNHKLLLLLGLVFIGVSALGCSTAPSFPILLIVYAISGLGYSIVEPMLYALVSEHLPLEQRPRAIGWLLTANALAVIIGSPVIVGIAGIRGWRWPFLGLVLPSALLGLMLVVKGVPSSPRSSQPMRRQGNYWEGFNEVFTNRSATACLIGTILAMIAWQAILLYSISFFRERLFISSEWIVILAIVTAGSFILGSQIGGQVITQFGMKPITVLTGCITGIFIILFLNMTNFWLALTFILLSCLFGGMRFTAANSLSLEQVPNFRGAMMSLNTLAILMGAALGAGIGGLVQFRAGYEGIGLVMGPISLVAAIIINFMVVDPTRTSDQEIEIDSSPIT